MSADRESNKRIHLLAQSGLSSLICTPRNARILLKFQTLHGEEDIALSTAREPDELPYLYEVEPRQPTNDILFVLTVAQSHFLDFLDAQQGDSIESIPLGGMEQIWMESLRATIEHKAPMIVRFFIAFNSGGVRHFESLIFPFANSQGGSVNRLIGALDEVGAEGPHANKIQWNSAATLRSSRVGIAHPFDA